jgi:hypothetical protein
MNLAKYNVWEGMEGGRGTLENGHPFAVTAQKCCAR